MATVGNRVLQWLSVSLIASAVLIGLAAEFGGSDSPNGQVINIDDPLNEILNRPGTDVMKSIRKKGRLVVLTRNSPTTYYLERDHTAGFEHDLVKAFAEHLGVEAEFRVFNSNEALVEAMEEGRGHIAAAYLTEKDAAEATDPVFGPAYGEVKLQLVCHRDGQAPSSFEDMSRTPIMVIADSDYEARLKRLAQDVDGLDFGTLHDFSTEDLMERVAERSIACTVGESPVVAINRRYYPELQVPLDLSGADKLRWMLIEGAPKLQTEVEKWFAREDTTSLIARLNERYYGHVPAYDYVDLRSFRRRMRDRLPKYREMFENAAEKTGLPWTLLAAVAYQESHWERDARSPTGVRGLMMLTQAAAQDMGVKNRLHAEQSINGGARYLASIKKRLPGTVTGEDRLWLALAAYNVGLGHLMDARELARRQNVDPDRWSDLKTVLPLLSQQAYYSTLTFGYARGNEPVRYVQRVRHYHDILEREFGPAPWDQARFLPAPTVTADARGSDTPTPVLKR